jgi:microcystin-dependent protein
MSIPLIVNGVTYNFPSPFDTNWAPAVDAWAIAVTNGLLQKSGGSFPLTSEVDFGNSFGLRTKYIKSEETNVSTTGFLRLASQSIGIGFRDFANSSDLILTTNASNQLIFNGTPIGTAAALTNSHIFVGNVSNQPADVAMSGDVTISNTGVTTISSGAITDAKVNAGAAISLSKLAALTPSTAVATDGSGFLVSSSTTAAELGFVSGVTSSIQTQINNISGATNPTGAIIMYGAASAPSGWLLCDGSAVNRTTFSALFAVISTTFGVGDGSTTFNVPNMVNNVPIGAGSTAALGTSVGTNTGTVSITDPGHNHTQNAHQHVGTSGVGGGQIYTGQSGSWPFGYTNETTTLGESAAAGTGSTTVGFANTSSTTATNNPSTTGITATNSTVQPSVGVTFIIKT